MGSPDGPVLIKNIYKQVIRGDEQELKTESKDAFLIFFQFKS